MLEEEKREQINMMLTLILVVGILFIFNKVMTAPPTTVSVPLASEQQVVQPDTESVVAADLPALQPKLHDITIPVSNSFVQGSLKTNYTTFDALDLTQYRQTTQADSPAVSLLTPDFKTDLIWQGLPAEPTEIIGQELTPETPVTLIWETDTLRLERLIMLDNAYLVTFKDTLINKTTSPASTALTGRVVRSADSVPDNRSTVHEGFLGLFDNKEKEVRYPDITDESSFTTENKGGWIGQTDKYWQAIFVPDQTLSSTMSFKRTGDTYISAFTTPMTIAGGQTITLTTRLFAGAKELKLINDYEAQGIPRFDLSIDFGWYYFLTKPFLYFLGWLYALVGNMGVAILIFATLLRIAMLPIATKSYESMAKMKKIQPKIKALQERFKDNRQQLQIEMMNLYRRDKVNPASGCLPMLIQIPVFFALYKVLSVSILMRQAPFFGWIHDLSQPDPASVFTAFGYLPWPIPHFLDLGVWPILMGLTMVIQQRMSPSVSTNKDQKVIMNLMPIVFTLMMGNFASGLVIYWTWSNILSIAQQHYIMKKVGV